MFESRLIKFLMSVLKWQVNSSSNFTLFFIVKSPLQIFWSYHFYFGQKDPIKVPLLTLSRTLVKNCQFFFKTCISFQCHERYLLYTFVAQTIYTLVRRNQLKHKFFRLSSAWVKICEVTHVNFKTTSQFLFNFCIIPHCHDA